MRRFATGLLFLLLAQSFYGEIVEAAETKRKVIKYRSHTNLDFSEQAVQGKIRSPDVFYIFQRRRSDGPKIVSPPRQLDSLRKDTKQVMENLL